MASNPEEATQEASSNGMDVQCMNGRNVGELCSALIPIVTWNGNTIPRE
jgi:hypothetical protein